MKNIFENAEFGDKFRTRDGRKFVYLKKVISLASLDCAYEGLAEHNGLMTYYNEDGKSLYCEYDFPGMDASSVDFGQVNSEEDSIDDIIGKWQKEINEKELDELASDAAEDYALKGTMTYEGFEDVRYHSIDEQRAFAEGVKFGYRKAIKR